MSKKLTEMTRDELRVEAKRLQIPGRGHMSKAELLAAVGAAMVLNPVVASSKKKATKKTKKTPKVKQARGLLNHVAIVLDRSGSMSTISKNAVDAVNEQIRELKRQAETTGQETTLTVSLFGSQHAVLYPRHGQDIKNVQEVNYYREYHIEGMTALYDAVGLAVDNLKKLKKTHDTDTSFLVLVVTDGQENASQAFSSHTFKKLITDLQGTDRWTFAFLVPQGNYKAEFSRKSGIPLGNIMEWETTEEGVKAASSVTTASLSSYYVNTRGTGKKSTGNFFVTDLSKVTPQQLANLEDLSPLVREASVDNDYTVQEYCQRRFGQFVQGAVFYELMKTEKLQNYKKILIMEKNGSRIFGGLQARKLLGLPNYEVKVKPGDHANYWVFVQSTSVNRKLKRGTKILFSPEVARR